jgi:AraC-like DNA-binding protein
LEAPGVSIADVAHALDYSSPQSFGRSLRATWGLTAGEFRRVYGLQAAIDDYKRQFVVPFQATFVDFKPLRVAHSLNHKL